MTHSLTDAEVNNVLQAWHDVQRQLEGLPERHPEAIALRREAAHLRREYQSSVRLAVEAYRASMRHERG